MRRKGVIQTVQQGFFILVTVNLSPSEIVNDSEVDY